MSSPTLTSERDREVMRSFARRIDPSDAGAYNNLGVLYYNKGLHEEAVATNRELVASMRRLKEIGARLTALRTRSVPERSSGEGTVGIGPRSASRSRLGSPSASRSA